jgi:GNAT superfamily N-acetyltransferase
MDFELSEPRAVEELEAYYQLRYERLRKPHGLPRGSELEGDIEKTSSHLVAKVDGRIVGAACWAVGMDRNPDTGARKIFVRFRQMAVDPEFEGKGLGGIFMRHVEEVSRKLGAAEVRGNVRAENVEYFKRFGWVIIGPGVNLFDEIESVEMIQPLA